MQSIRQALCNHMETMRTFVSTAARVDSGIYEVEQLDELFRQPGKFVELETDWICALLDLLYIIQRYIRLVERWANHVMGIAQNLGATEAEALKIQLQQMSAIEVFQQKQFNLDYLRWVLADASEEVDRLAVTSQNLLSDGSKLVELIERFGGPFLDQVKKITLAWMGGERRDFYKPLIDILQVAHTTTNPKKILQQLGQYLDAVAILVSSTPMFVNASTTPTSYSAEELQTSQGLVTQLIQSIEDLSNFVGLRTQAYMLVLRHEEALMRAVLPPSIPVAQWLATHVIDQSKSTDEHLPETLSTETLPLALQQAAEALIEWDTAIKTAFPHFEQALSLNNLLQSPAITKFLAADQRRLELYHEWRPQIRTTFSNLRATVTG